MQMGIASVNTSIYFKVSKEMSKHLRHIAGIQSKADNSRGMIKKVLVWVRFILLLRKGGSMQKNKIVPEDMAEQLIYTEQIPEVIVLKLPDEQRKQYFIWDEIMKMGFKRHPRLILPLIAELFGERYNDETLIEFLSTEYALERYRESGLGTLHSVRADIVLRIGRTDIYHFECQITVDGEMVIRMYEYDLQIALIHSKGTETDIFGKEKRTVWFPRSAVLHIDSSEFTEENMVLNFRFPNGTDYSYEVPVMKVQSYDLQQIYDKKLYFLIPFLPIRFRRELKKRESQLVCSDLTAFISECIMILARAVTEAQITRDEYGNIMDMLNRSIGYLFGDNKEIVKEVQKLMEPLFRLRSEIIEEEVTERVTEQVTERVTEQVTEQVTERVTEQMLENVVRMMQKRGVRQDELVQELMENFSLSKEEAERRVKLYWK